MGIMVAITAEIMEEKIDVYGGAQNGRGICKMQIFGVHPFTRQPMGFPFVGYGNFFAG